VNPKERNLLDALNLLTLLFRARKQSIPKLNDEQQHTLTVTKEHLALAELSTPIFINTLKTLHERGYLMAVSIFEDKAHLVIQESFSDEKYSEILKEIEKVDTKEVQEKLKLGIADVLEKMKPANQQFDRDGFMNEKVTIKDLLETTREVLKNHTNEDVSTVILMPFRSIERLLEKMNEGITFDEVRDAGVWYENDAGLLHFDEQSISTNHTRKRYVHFALQSLFGQFKNNQIDFVEIPEFDDAKGKEKELKSFRDSLSSFIKKHKRLSEIFSVHSTYLEINEEYLG